MKVAVPLAKKILAPLGITAAASAIDGAIQKNTWFWNNNLVISNEKIDDIMKIVQALEDSIMKGVT